MEVPPGMRIDQADIGNKLQLLRSLYGLKQSGCEWNRKSDEELRRIGFVLTQTEECMYVKRTDDVIVILESTWMIY
jgi:Reverse transcriptase (RNA-dependent DNA polymerase)